MDKKQSEYELRKISQGVFDKSSLTSLCRLASKGHLDELKGIISTGKEANVYYGIKGVREVAVKMYSIETSDFRAMDKYIRGDRRFTAWKNKRQLIYNWARKEYCNLKRVYGRIKCPEPIAFEKNIVVMGFIGCGGVPAPRMKDSPPEDPQKFLAGILKYMKTMYSEGFVHGDLSEYNVLNRDEEPCLIDFSMGVLHDHPLSDELLQRDVKNVLNYFRKLGATGPETTDAGITAEIRESGPEG
ncbi:MAG: serine protein kinase RIO [Candidatus Altiarchaeota archaeon]|nr:serine protein kinase RIO [Candidatus Altiarchaeota archaeon]